MPELDSGLSLVAVDRPVRGLDGMVHPGMITAERIGAAVRTIVDTGATAILTGNAGTSVEVAKVLKSPLRRVPVRCVWRLRAP